MEVLGPADGFLKPQEIIAKFSEKGGPLDQLSEAARDPQYDAERQLLVNRARYRWHMVKGNQFIAPGSSTDSGGREALDFVAVDSSGSPDENGAEVTFAYALNVLGGDCRKYVAVMGQSAPAAKCVAEDPASADDLQAATDSDAVLRDAWSKLKIDQKWRVIALHQYTTGPVFIHTPWVTDGTKYGRSQEPKIDVVYQESPDGGRVPVPVQNGVQEYDNGDVEAHVCSVLEVSVPFGAKSLDECGWLRYEYMERKWKLLTAFPEQLEKYRTSDPPDDDLSASSTTSAEARDSVSVPSGVGRPRKTNEWRYQQLYLRPENYEAITDSAARDVFKKQYPDGVYLAKVGSVYVALDDRPLDDEWVIVKTGIGEKVLDDPICADGVPFQRALNDLGNLAIESVLRGIAKTIIDQMLLDRNSVSKNEALPAEIIFTTTPLGTDINKMIAQIPPSRMSDQLVPLFELLRSQMQDITGIRPELSGGGAPTQTYREAKQRKDQALAQLGPQAAEMRAAAEQIGRNLVRQRARYGSGTVKSARRSAFGVQTDVVDLASLMDSGWKVESDDNFPMTTADASDKLYGLLKEYPEQVQQALSLLDPMNLERNLQLLQLPGYESVYEDQKRKTLNDIKQLVQGQVAPGQPGPNGEPGPPQPSLQPDEYDDHQFVADFMRKWMVSPEGQRLHASNPPAFENVKVFWSAHQQMAQPPQPPPPPAVPARLNLTAKLEDFPALVPEVLQGAGLPPSQAQTVPPQPAQPQQQGDALPAPDSPEPKPQEKQESPLPPLEDPGQKPQFLQ